VQLKKIIPIILKYVLIVILLFLSLSLASFFIWSIFCFVNLFLLLQPKDSTYSFFYYLFFLSLSSFPPSQSVSFFLFFKNFSLNIFLLLFRSSWEPFSLLVSLSNYYVSLNRGALTPIYEYEESKKKLFFIIF